MKYTGITEKYSLEKIKEMLQGGIYYHDHKYHCCQGNALAVLAMIEVNKYIDELQAGKESDDIRDLSCEDMQE